MWELDCQESWAPKNWCSWTGVLEKTLESPLDCKEIQPVHPKGDQPWMFIGSTDAEAETPILWPPHMKSWLIGKDPDAGRDWGAEDREDRRWDGWMASPTQCTWVWVNSGHWGWTERPGVLWFMGLQRVGHNGDWTELIWTMNEISGGDGLLAELFQILRDDAIKVLHSICQQIWKSWQWPQDWERSVLIPIPKKGNAPEFWNYHTIALISNISKVMLKILQTRLQQYMNHELPDIQAGFRKGRGIRD